VGNQIPQNNTKCSGETSHPPERFRPHYLFILACITTSSNLSSITRVTLVPSDKNRHLHDIGFEASTRAFEPSLNRHQFMEIYISLTGLLLPETINGFTRLLNVPLL